MEGPSLIILREELQNLVGQNVRSCSSTVAKLDCDIVRRKQLESLGSWGKHFLLCFPGFTIKIHFLMFGSYRVNDERVGKTPKLTLTFRDNTIHFYSCSVQVLTDPLESVYDWRVDLMSAAWDEKHVRSLLSKQLEAEVCDAILDQTIFAGAGNIIKNEVLFKLKLNPEETLASIAPRMRAKLIREMRTYCFQFYEWKKAFVLKKNWRVYRKRKCPVCAAEIEMRKTGKLQRVSFFCQNCQPKQ